MGITDGLGGEEVNQTVTTTEVISGTNVYATTAVTTVDVTATGSVAGGQLESSNNVHLSAGSPYGKGIVVQMSARSNISGGMFVIASGNLALAAPASTKHPLGVAEPGTDVASGGTVNIITHGIVPVVAEGTIAIGAAAIMGAGAAQNCVLPASSTSGLRTFSTLDAGGSGATVFIAL